MGCQIDTNLPGCLAPMKKADVLIVDDDPISIKVLDALSKRMNLSTVVAIDGANALQVLEQYQVDWVITDLRMPMMNGFDLIKALHEAGITSDQILVTTTDDGSSARKQLNELGIRHHFTKPLELSKIECVLNTGSKP